VFNMLSGCNSQFETDILDRKEQEISESY